MSPARRRPAIALVAVAFTLVGCQGTDQAALPDLGEPEPVALDVRWARIVSCLAGLGYDAQVTDDGVGMITDPLPPEETDARDVVIEACSAKYPQLASPTQDGTTEEYPVPPPPT